MATPFDNCYMCGEASEDTAERFVFAHYEGQNRKTCHDCLLEYIREEELGYEALQQAPIDVVAQCVWSFSTMTPSTTPFPQSLQSQVNRFPVSEFAQCIRSIERTLREAHEEDEEEDEEELEDPSSSSAEEEETTTENPNIEPKPKILKAKFRK